jgi:hypothetical protein
MGDDTPDVGKMFPSATGHSPAKCATTASSLAAAAAASDCVEVLTPPRRALRTPVRNGMLDAATPVAAAGADAAAATEGSVGGWAGRGLFSAALAWLLYRRLGEIQRDMAGLMARFQSGRLWRVMTRASAKRPVPESVGSATACGVGAGDGAAGARIWPRDFGWLVRFAAYQAAGFGLQLRNVLTQPDMVALLAAAPRARRVLRPLCRMLAVETALGVLRVHLPAWRAPFVPEIGAALRLGWAADAPTLVEDDDAA